MWDTSFNSLLYAGQYEEFLSSLALKPDGARTSFYRGLARLYLKDDVQAVKEFDLAYQIDRTYPHAVIGQAMKAALSGSNAEGSSLLRDLERDRTLTDGEMLYKLAQAHSMLGNHQDALRLLSKSVDQNFSAIHTWRTMPCSTACARRRNSLPSSSLHAKGMSGSGARSSKR